MLVNEMADTREVMPDFCIINKSRRWETNDCIRFSEVSKLFWRDDHHCSKRYHLIWCFHDGDGEHRTTHCSKVSHWCSPGWISVEREGRSMWFKWVFTYQTIQWSPYESNSFVSPLITILPYKAYVVPLWIVLFFCTLEESTITRPMWNTPILIIERLNLSDTVIIKWFLIIFILKINICCKDPLNLRRRTFSLWLMVY